MEIVCLLVGVIVGMSISAVIYHVKRRRTPKHTIGDLVIDKTSSTITPYLALEPSTDLAALRSKTRVELLVEVVK